MIAKVWTAAAEQASSDARPRRHSPSPKQWPLFTLAATTAERALLL
jgi:hypothetical protein